MRERTATTETEAAQEKLQRRDVPRLVERLAGGGLRRVRALGAAWLG